LTILHNARGKLLFVGYADKILSETLPAKTVCENNRLAIVYRLRAGKNKNTEETFFASLAEFCSLTQEIKDHDILLSLIFKRNLKKILPIVFFS